MTSMHQGCHGVGFEREMCGFGWQHGVSLVYVNLVMLCLVKFGFGRCGFREWLGDSSPPADSRSWQFLAPFNEDSSILVITHSTPLPQKDKLLY